MIDYNGISTLHMEKGLFKPVLNQRKDIPILICLVLILWY